MSRVVGRGNLIRNDLYHFRKNSIRKTQKEVASDLGMSYAMYQVYESGTREMRLSDAKTLADYFELTLDELYEKLTGYKENGSYG